MPENNCLDGIKTELGKMINDFSNFFINNLETKFAYILFKVGPTLNKNFYTEFCYLCAFLKKFLELKTIHNYLQGLINLNETVKYILDYI